MPITSMLVLAAIVFAFVVFGALLAWGEYQTRHLSSDTGKRDQETHESNDSMVRLQSGFDRDLDFKHSRPKGVEQTMPSRLSAQTTENTA